MARDKLQIQRGIQAALSERDNRVACLIVEGMGSLFDLLEEQSPSVIEALIEHVKNLERPGKGLKQRHVLRAALIEWGQQSLREAQARERRLFQGITGLDEEPPGKLASAE
jgi:hypothetical protein